MSKRKLPPSGRPERQISGPEMLGHWLSLHVKRYQSAYRVAASKGFGDYIVVATPYDRISEPNNFGLYGDRADLYRRLPSMTPGALDPPPAGYFTAVASQATGMYKGTYVAHILIAGDDERLPNVVVGVVSGQSCVQIN